VVEERIKMKNSLTVGWIGSIEDLKVVDSSKLLSIRRENPNICFNHQFFEFDVDEIPRKSDGPGAVGLDIEVWVSEGMNPRARYPFELFVYHRCPELPGHAKDWDELYEQVKRGIWIQLHPQEFQEEIIQALGRERLKELHRKAFLPFDFNSLKDLGGSLTMREIREEADIVRRASTDSNPELEAVLQQVAQAPDCKICGHKMQKSGATYECSNCGE